jgi:diketogulonate reductase-like aldo/keto reductase
VYNALGFGFLEHVTPWHSSVSCPVVVEIKSTNLLPVTAHRQLLNYLRATNLEVALLSPLRTGRKVLSVRELPQVIGEYSPHSRNPRSGS